MKLPRLPRLSLGRRAPEPDPVEPPPAIVLSGGARMGAVQVGVLRALAARGVRPGAVVGTSAGAFNGAFLAFYPEDARYHQLRAIWQDLRFHRIFNHNPVRIFINAAVRRDRVYDNAELRQMLDRHMRSTDIADAAIPLYVVATNLTTGEKTVFSSGPLTPAVLASAAIPGFLPPVEIDGHLYVDGAVTANLDIETAVALGARHVIAIDVSASVEPAPGRSIGAVLSRSLEIVMRGRMIDALERLAPRVRVTLLRPGPLTMHNLARIRSMSDLLDEADRVGEDLVARALGAHGRFSHGLFSNEPPAVAPVLVRP